MSAQDEVRVAGLRPERRIGQIGAVRTAEILRSLVRCRPSDPSDKIAENLRVVREAELKFALQEDEEVHQSVQAFAAAHGHAPELQTVLGQLRADGKLSAVDRLEAVLGEPIRTGGDFAYLVEVIVEQFNRDWMLQVAKDALAAARSGLEIPEGRSKRKIQGVAQAAQYLIEQVRDLAQPNRKNLGGEVTKDTSVGAQEYAAREADPGAAFGQWTGIKQIDDSIGGARAGELWIHAAYSGHLKTTLALNWAYCQSVGYHQNVLYYSLEMPYPQVRRWIYAMHSYHSKFAGVRQHFGLQSSPDVGVGLDYKKIRDAQLTPGEKDFYLKYVLPDLEDPKNEYGQIHVEVADPSKADITVEGLRDRAEEVYQKTPFGMAFVDHASLLGTRSKWTSKFEAQAESLRDLKTTALNFRRGQGLPVVALYQINREGLREAQKRKDKGQLPTYDLYNLANSSEAERSADVVTATYLDKEYSQRSRALLTCLKSRDNAPFDPCLLRVEWPCRRLLGCDESAQVDTSTQVPPDDKDVVAALDSLNTRKAA